jgi:hypothetical protein
MENVQNDGAAADYTLSVQLLFEQILNTVCLLRLWKIVAAIEVCPL